MIQYRERESAAWITLSNPGKKNSLSPGGFRELVEVVEQAESEGNVVVLRGDGDCFCSGADLDVLAEIDDEADAERFAGDVVDAFLTLERVGVPVVAAVNGDAFGAGFELVTASDLAVAVEGARFAMPAMHIGVYAPYTAERVEVTGGRKRLMELMLTGEPINADTALEWGLVNEVVEEGVLGSRVEGVIEKVGNAGLDAVRITKEVGRKGYPSEERDRMVEYLSELIAADETRERLREVRGV